MDPFNLFWKTVAGLEKIMNYPVRTEWDADFQRGYMIVGGVDYVVFSSPSIEGVRVLREIDEDSVRYRDISKAHDHFMIADAMEFILAEVVL